MQPDLIIKQDQTLKIQDYKTKESIICVILHPQGLRLIHRLVQENSCKTLIQKDRPKLFLSLKNRLNIIFTCKKINKIDN